MLTNAKRELLDHLEECNTKVKCAYILHSPCGYGEDSYDITKIILTTPHTAEQYNTFLDQLNNLRYDSGYGSQKLYGTIWYEDGTWSSRGEYDGSEWWEHNKLPPIPTVCISDNDKSIESVNKLLLETEEYPNDNINILDILLCILIPIPHILIAWHISTL